jgi:hypothetical protein
VKESHLYQRYLAEVGALNQAKDYLAIHRDQMPLELKRRLMNQILGMETRLCKFEKEKLERSNN